MARDVRQEPQRHHGVLIQSNVADTRGSRERKLRFGSPRRTGRQLTEKACDPLAIVSLLSCQLVYLDLEQCKPLLNVSKY
jgi:hypothetical protein